MQRKIYKRLTVGDLRRELEGVPDDTPVLVDFQTEYDGTEVEKQGTATWCMAVESPVRHLRIDATEEFRS